MSGFSNPIIGGGGALVYPSIHSPNFTLSPLTGWSIDKDGNAYFANVTVSGSYEGTDFVISSAGIFFYSGTPAAGNLIISIAKAGGTDSYGNTYPEGVKVQTAAGGQGVYLDPARSDTISESWAITTTAAVDSALELPTGASSEQQPGYLASIALSKGAANEQLGTLLLSQLTSLASWCALMLTSEAADGSAGASAILGYMAKIGANAYRIHRMLALYPASNQAVLGPGMGLFASTPGFDATESWNSMTLLNSWTNNFAGEYGPAYAWLGLRGGCVGFRGVIKVPAGGISAVFATLPSGYAPSGVNTRWAARNLTHTSDVVYGVLHGSGDLNISGTAAAGDQIDICGIAWTG